jgi:catechol 2,3-dioxygenase-like lactoylglutathione lyase family enzyme
MTASGGFSEATLGRIMRPYRLQNKRGFQPFISPDAAGYVIKSTIQCLRRQSMWTLNRIDHVVLWCRDLDKSLAFYQAIGFEIDEPMMERYRAGQMRFVKINAGDHNSIDLRPDPNWQPVEREAGNMQHLNVVADGVDDIQVIIDELAKHGLHPDFGPEIQGGAWGFDIYDPDNNRIEVRLATRVESEAPAALSSQA